MAMTFLGIGEVIGAPMFGYIRDKAGNKSALIILVIMTGLALSSFLYLNQVNKWSNIAYLMNLLWGFQDGALNTFIICIFGYEFENEAISFSCFNFV